MRMAKKDNETMLDMISFGGYINQLTDDYYPNNRVYAEFISELSKYKSGALLNYGDKIFNLDKSLTVRIEDIYIDHIPISNVIYYCEEAEIKNKGKIKCNLSRYTFVKHYFLHSSLCSSIDHEGHYMLITNSRCLLNDIPISRIKECEDSAETKMYYSDYCWCYRLYRRQDGYYAEKIKINLADYYICPTVFMDIFISAIQHQADNNILIVTYIDRNGNECRIHGTSSEEWYSRNNQIAGRYIHNTTTNGAKIRLASTKTGKITVIPLHRLVVYYIYDNL